MTNELSVFDIAVAAYRESCNQNGSTFNQPIEEYSNLMANIVYLRTSSTGYVARYDTRRRRILV